MGGTGWDEAGLSDLPEACDLAVWYATHVPQDYVYGLKERLVEHLKQHPEDPDAAQLAQLLQCLYAILE